MISSMMWKIIDTDSIQFSSGVIAYPDVKYNNIIYALI